jgi:hypothetical protein
MTPTYNIAAAMNFPGYWRGAAQTRRFLADQLRADGKAKEADHYLTVASDYERHAESVTTVARKKQ